MPTSRRSRRLLERANVGDPKGDQKAKRRRHMLIGSTSPNFMAMKYAAADAAPTKHLPRR